MEEYTSDELSQIGSSAPSHTVEETIESMCQKDIAAAQLQFKTRSEKICSPEVMDLFFEQHQGTPDIEARYDKEVNQAMAILRRGVEQEIEALQVLRDYRTANYHQETE